MQHYIWKQVRTTESWDPLGSKIGSDDHSKNDSHLPVSLLHGKNSTAQSS